MFGKMVLTHGMFELSHLFRIKRFTVHCSCQFVELYSNRSSHSNVPIAAKTQQMNLPYSFQPPGQIV